MLPYNNIVVLTGAGISAESGIRTFRAADGLWEDHRVEDVATPEAFIRDPELVHRFYNQRRQHLLGDISANAGHFALARLEQGLLQRGGEFLLITQNIDNLHEQAGSKNLWINQSKKRQERKKAKSRTPRPCRDGRTAQNLARVSEAATRSRV